MSKGGKNAIAISIAREGVQNRVSKININPGEFMEGCHGFMVNVNPGKFMAGFKSCHSFMVNINP